MTDLDLMPRLANLDGFADESKVWFYIADKPLSDEGQALTQQVLGEFVKQWTAHNNALKSAAELFAGRIILLMVDESQAGASGCSIDKSVHFIKRLGQEVGVDFFNPFTSAWVDSENLYVGAMEDLKEVVKEKKAELQIINSQVKSKFDLRTRWLLPLESSWQSRFV